MRLVWNNEPYITDPEEGQCLVGTQFRRYDRASPWSFTKTTDEVTLFSASHGNQDGNKYVRLEQLL